MDLSAGFVDCPIGPCVFGQFCSVNLTIGSRFLQLVSYPLDIIKAFLVGRAAKLLPPTARWIRPKAKSTEPTTFFWPHLVLALALDSRRSELKASPRFTMATASAMLCCYNPPDRF